MFEYQFWFILGYMSLIYKREAKVLIPLSIAFGGVGACFYASVVHFVNALVGIWLTYLLAQSIRNITENRFVSNIVKNSFGIYLFHPIIIYVLYYYLGNCQFNGYLCTMCVSRQFCNLLFLNRSNENGKTTNINWRKVI